MGVYCFKISNHGVQHAVVTMHIVTEADLIRIHAPSSRNECILPRPTHTHLESECDNETSYSTNVFQRHYSRQSTVHVQYPTTSCVYVRSSSLCVPLLPGNQHTERLHNLVHEWQRIWLPVDLGLLANAVHRHRDVCRQSLWRLQLSAMTLTSREISAFCGRWNNQLGSARSLPLTMTANGRSCENTMPLAETELLTSSTHWCIDLSGHPAIADDRCWADHPWPTPPHAL